VAVVLGWLWGPTAECSAIAQQVIEQPQDDESPVTTPPALW
jgi:hypothetical protein